MCVCVCVCERERERERARVYVRVCVCSEEVGWLGLGFFALWKNIRPIKDRNYFYVIETKYHIVIFCLLLLIYLLKKTLCHFGSISVSSLYLLLSLSLFFFSHLLSFYLLSHFFLILTSLSLTLFVSVYLSTNLVLTHFVTLFLPIFHLKMVRWTAYSAKRHVLRMRTSGSVIITDAKEIVLQ